LTRIFQQQWEAVSRLKTRYFINLAIFGDEGVYARLENGLASATI